MNEVLETRILSACDVSAPESAANVAHVEATSRDRNGATRRYEQNVATGSLRIYLRDVK